MKKYRIGSITVTEGKFGSVFVIRPSPLDKGKVNTMAISGPSAEKIAGWLTAKLFNRPRAMIQDAFPTLSNEEREYLLTGYTPHEWDRVFPKGEEDDGKEI